MQVARAAAEPTEHVEARRPRERRGRRLQPEGGQPAEGGGGRGQPVGERAAPCEREDEARRGGLVVAVAEQTQHVGVRTASAHRQLCAQLLTAAVCAAGGAPLEGEARRGLHQLARDHRLWRHAEVDRAEAAGADRVRKVGRRR
eukprot:2570748-Prymnesium_polylepis.1